MLELHGELQTGTYQHGQYTRFVVHDPKRRMIAKASVRDRVLHHAIHRVLVPVFDQGFIFDSYSSRLTKGTHAAGKRFRDFSWKVSRNHTCTVWVLQCDIQKFFDSVDHEILLSLLRKKIHDARAMQLLEIVIRSFQATSHRGIPLGNLTSQLFSNVYLDPLDQYVKRKLRVKQYVRYADDFVLLSHNLKFLESCLVEISCFLDRELRLALHPEKVRFRKWHTGIDFLGYVHFPFHAVVRTKTKRRLLRRLNPQNASSYFGVTLHARAFGLERKMRDILKI